MPSAVLTITGDSPGLVPVPEVDSLDELNLRLARDTAAEERRCRARQTDTVGQRFAAERPLLAPLPVRPFHRFRQSLATRESRLDEAPVTSSPD